MRHFDGAFTGGDQAGVHQLEQHLANLLRFERRPGRDQLDNRNAPAGILGAFAQLGKAQENGAGNFLLLDCKLLVKDSIGGVCNGPAHTAGLCVGVQVHQVAAAAQPGFQ